MSTSMSIGNFYVDHEGCEQPIIYKAADLVNRPVPEGYHWEMDTRKWRIERALFLRASESERTVEHRDGGFIFFWDIFPLGWQRTPPIVDAYICVRNA